MLFLQAEDGTSQLESENSQTRKKRSKGKIARESTEQHSDIVWKFVLRFVVVVNFYFISDNIIIDGQCIIKIM